MIRPYLVDATNDHKIKSEWKIQLAAVINIVSSKPDSDENRIMHTKSNNEEIMIGSETNEVIEELFKSILQGYQQNLEEKKCVVQGSYLTVLMCCIMILIRQA